MLMASALSCDSSHAPITRLQSALFASPPSSPPPSTQSTFGHIVSSCRALQNMLAAPSTPESDEDTSIRRTQLPTPPLSHAPLPPLKLRLRSRKADTNGDVIPRKKVVKRPVAPPRGPNKRRRDSADDMGRDDDIDSDLEIGGSDVEQDQKLGEEDNLKPRTPKRARIAPEVIPLGLERTDYHNLHAEAVDQDVPNDGTDIELEADGETWSKEDDRILVELVLEKLKLSKSEWQDCARSLGKDRSSLGRRWRSLMINGDVGLKPTSRRTRIHSTWR